MATIGAAGSTHPNNRGIKFSGLRPDVISYGAGLHSCQLGAAWTLALKLTEMLERLVWIEGSEQTYLILEVFFCLGGVSDSCFLVLF